MSDELKKILSRELEELKQNKIRAGALGVCFVFVIIFWLGEDDSGEEVNLTEQQTPAPPVTKDLPTKPLPAPKIDDGVTVVLGADADALNIADPFAGEEKPKPPPKVTAPTPPPQIVLPPPIPPPTKPEVKDEPKEKIILTGTAVSGNIKTAMFLRDKKTIFLTVGDEIGGRKILDITPDCVIFKDGARAYLQKELN